MKLEQQVPELKLCKKLKELGYPQEGLFYWCNPYMRACSDSEYKIYDLPTSTKDYVAPTVAELGDWLPKTIHKDGRLEGCGTDVYYFQHYGDYTGYWNASGKSLGGLQKENTEANARAKMLIWLVENGYVSFDKNETK